MKEDTLLTHGGRRPQENHGVVNPPVYRASTILFPDMDTYNDRMTRKQTSFSYGIDGTPTNFAFAEAIAELEGGARTLITSSGLSAITIALLAFLKQGDHLLVTDSAYGPTRSFCDHFLARFGIETTFYDPSIGAGIGDFIQENTRVVFMESPGSFTFEVQDVPTIAKVARERGVVSMVDNTWASPLFCKPLRLGADISIHAATKYISGHADLLLGVVTAREENIYQRMREGRGLLGDCSAPDVCYQALRGLRTLGVRIRHHAQAALEIAAWLQTQPQVKRVLHPGLPGDPGHALWQRDFSGCSGLFGVVLHTGSEQAVRAMLDGLKWFGMGASWGGFESLIIPVYLAAIRSAVPWQESGQILRIHIGLEDISDLKEDLAAGLARLDSAGG